MVDCDRGVLRSQDLRIGTLSRGGHVELENPCCVPAWV